jgi:hypothetical protein
MKKALTLLIILFTGWQLSNGQSLSPWVLASSGGYASNASYSLSWTLGEIAVTTLSNGTYILNQGFQQALVVGTGIGDNLLINWSIQVYPNPVSDVLHLKFSLENPNNFAVEVLDMTGKKMLIRTLTGISDGDETELDMSGLAQGIYFVSIRSEDNNVSQTVRIQKYK